MRIAITMRVVKAPDYVESRDAISHDWLDFLKDLGHVTIPVPNRLDDPVEYIEDCDVDGIVLSNGEDIAVQEQEGDSALSVESDRERTEYCLLEYAARRKLPVLGVCRGMQFINLFFEGMVGRIGSSESGHLAREHEVQITCDPVAEVIGRHIIVNSYHSWGIQLHELSPRLRVFAFQRESGICEGIYHPNLPILGVQWHPERPNHSQEENGRLITHFLRKGLGVTANV